MFECLGPLGLTFSVPVSFVGLDRVICGCCEGLVLA